MSQPESHPLHPDNDDAPEFSERAKAGRWIDDEHLARVTFGDKPLEAEVLTIFAEQARMWMRLLEPDAADEDWRTAAHTLKGAAGGVGAVAVAGVCAHAETLVADAGTTVARAVALNDLRAVVEPTLDHIAWRVHAIRVGDLKTEG